MPGVKELFEHAAKIQEKISPEEMKERADLDYFGLRDEDDGSLLRYENARDGIEKSKLVPSDDSLDLEYIPFPYIPPQKEVEEWLVSKRRNDLETKFLQGPTLRQS